MKISARIFLGYFLIVGLAAWLLLNTFIAQLRPGVRQSVEEVMVDVANLLAEIVEREVETGAMSDGEFAREMRDFMRRELNANIWDLKKSNPSLRVYITDRKGRLIYDSEGAPPGSDYSQWRDVYLTLRGEYGARSTPLNPGDELSTVMHVAAPIRRGNEIIGVLTVAKPNSSVQPFIEIGERKMTRISLLLVAASLLVGLFFAWWFTVSIRSLAQYARKVSRRERAPLPEIRESELAELGDAMERMRRELEGKDYVENYIHTLTHEMKSPLSAIKGAAELLQEEMPPAERGKFLRNILGEAGRLQDLVSRMLDLAVVEKRQSLQDVEAVRLGELAEEVAAGKAAEIRSRGLRLRVDVPQKLVVPGERFLLRQALLNLLDNAIAFSGAGGAIAISGAEQEGHCEIVIVDGGPGIPEYARERVFDRFYSLPRPDSGRKSTGLGLSFVREVALLHHGSVRLENLPQGGLAARLLLPAPSAV
ncbi:MAG TPA: two-component system sensor histidine kinase CreC [Gammaproteobacteria bacterium]|nr:two-component system sensor histidine kinase CreC [Gammaproteobacteria bacterium]